MAPKRMLGKLALALFVTTVPTFVPQAGASLSFSLHGKMVLLQANLGMSRGRLASEADGLVAACEGLPAAACLKAPLARGWPQQVNKPHTQLRAWDLARTWSWLTRKHERVSIIGKLVNNKSSFDIVMSIVGIVFVLVQVLQGWAAIRRANLDSERAKRDSERAKRDSERAKRDSERAKRDSPQGRMEAAVKQIMQPYEPKTKKPVVHRAIFEAIRQRIKHWESDATIIAGRFGSGKSVAVREALRGAQGVFVHSIEDADWKDKLFKRLGLTGPDMLEEVLGRVQAQLEKLGGLSKVPIIVLDIPRTTMEGMDTVSSFAKYLCSDDTMDATAHVIVCASSAAMALSFDAGGEQRQENYWVEDLTVDEAKELLALHGHREDWEQFVNACGYRALDLVRTCKKYKGPATLAAKKEEMKAKAREEVLRFLKGCKMKTLDGVVPAGENILNALVQDRRAGGTGVGALTGGSVVLPKDVAKWIRDNSAHAVIWHMPDQKYRFASELHAEAAVDILKQSQSSP